MLGGAGRHERGRLAAKVDLLAPLALPPALGGRGGDSRRDTTTSPTTLAPNSPHVAPPSPRIAILGAGALGAYLGARLARAGRSVALVETDPAIVRAIEAGGVEIAGADEAVRVPITTDPATLGPVDLVVVCVRYWQTEAAVRAALPSIGPETAVVTFQAGWGDADLIAGIVGPGRTLIGLSANTIVSTGPGRVAERFGGTTLVGGYAPDPPAGWLEGISAALDVDGFVVRAEGAIRQAIWGTIATDACALPLCAILRHDAYQLTEHAGTLDLMRAMHREFAAVGATLGCPLDEEAHWGALCRLLEGATGPWAGIFQEMRDDLERLGRSDVDRLNGAVVAAGRRCGIPTPYNEAVLWLVRSQERRDDGVM
jgi:2-dehydropantoate 2-reductase